MNLWYTNNGLFHYLLNWLINLWFNNSPSYIMFMLFLCCCCCCWWSITIILSYGRLLKVENTACQINIREEFLGRHITKNSWRSTYMYTHFSILIKLHLNWHLLYDSIQIHTKSYTFIVDQFAFILFLLHMYMLPYFWSNVCKVLSQFIYALYLTRYYIKSGLPKNKNNILLIYTPCLTV